MIYDELIKYDCTNLQHQLHIAILNKKKSYEEKSPRAFNFWNTQIELIKNKIDTFQLFT